MKLKVMSTDLMTLLFIYLGNDLDANQEKLGDFFLWFKITDEIDDILEIIGCDIEKIDNLWLECMDLVYMYDCDVPLSDFIVSHITTYTDILEAM